MIKYHAITDIGPTREKNEDAILVANNKYGDYLFLIADGMGGHNAGEVASNMVKEIVEKEFLALEENVDYREFLERVINHANNEVYKKSLLEIEYNNMGTTLSMMILSGDQIYIGHVGDSRIYFITDKSIRLLTHDHTLVQAMLDAKTITPEEAQNSKFKNVLLQALGTSKNVTLQTLSAKIPEKCRFILCSDGLTGPVSEHEINDIMCSNKPLEERVEMLLKLANFKDGRDNVSIIGVERE